MKPKTSPFFLCRLKNRPDARCRNLRRCRVCGRVLRFVFADLVCTQEFALTISANVARQNGGGYVYVDLSKAHNGRTTDRFRQ